MIEVGASRAVSDSDVPQYGRLARASLGRQLTPESSLRLTFGNEISKTYTYLLGGLTNPAVGGSNTATTDLYRIKRGDFSYAFQGERFGYTLQGYARRVDYEHFVEQDYRGGGLASSWLHSGVMRFHVNADHLRRRFPSLDRTDVERDITGGVTYKLTRNLSTAVEASRLESQSSEPVGFVARRVLLLLTWSSSTLYPVQTTR